MSKSDSPDLSSRNHSETTIVQCPGCSTRFAVDSSVIAQLDFPRFHCSRCDHVFALTESAGATRSVSNIEPVIADQTERAPEPEVFQSATYQEADSEAHEDSQEVPYANGKTGQWESVPTTPKITRIEQLEHTSLEIPSLLNTSKIESAPPHETVPTAKLAAPSFQSVSAVAAGGPQLEMPFNFSESKSSAAPEGSISGPKISRPKPEWELGVESPSASSEFSGMASSNYTAEFLTKNYRDEDRTITPPEIMREPGVVLPSSGTPQGWYALSIIVAPILIFLGLIGGLSLYMTSSENGAGILNAGLFPSVPQVPPAELHLKEPRFKKVTLENGENVYVVSGAVSNRGEKSLRDITLEGVAFDAQGRPIFSTRVNLGATLSKARLRSLSPEMIQKLQYGQINKSSDLMPGDEQDFAFAMLPDSNSDFQQAGLNRAQYFGARIYSVHN